MERVYLCITFLILLGSFQTCEAQYAGGIGNGYSSNVYILAPCPYGVTTNIFYGGDASSFTKSTLIVTICPPVSNSNIYGGGDAGGYASNKLIVTICPPIVNTNLFVGGVGQGHATSAYIASICPPIISTNIYSGGIADGSVMNSLIVTVCPPILNTNIYYGGVSDGFSSNNYIASICPPILNTNIYYGGVNDGLATKKIIQTVCILVPLPIELLSFNINCVNNNRLFTWTTASETNNNYFTIEGSINASAWKKISTVTGAGNATTKRNYSYVDSLNKVEATYYRLKQTDFDGKFKYSNLIYNNCGKESTSSFNVFPNPSNGKINVLYTGSTTNVYSVHIYNSLGESVYSTDRFQPFVDLSENPPGVYLIQLTLKSKSLIKKIIIE